MSIRRDQLIPLWTRVKHISLHVFTYKLIYDNVQIQHIQQDRQVHFLILYSVHCTCINFNIKDPYAKRFMKDEKITKTAYIANSGGLLGLCMGFSLGILSYYKQN